MAEFPLRRFPPHPAHPERICWGCHYYCPADSMRCGNGSERTQHPSELLGDDWMDFGLDAQPPAPDTGGATPPDAGVVKDPAPARDSSPATRTP